MIDFGPRFFDNVTISGIIAAYSANRSKVFPQTVESAWEQFKAIQDLKIRGLEVEATEDAFNRGWTLATEDIEKRVLNGTG